jgi:uncharacterized heparinase superfamily protein
VGLPAIQPEVAGLSTRMRVALFNLRHPDGGIALLNDAVLGIYADGWRDDPVPRGAWALPAAGYYGWRGDRGDYLVVDAAPVGPAHQPGHTHADHLSFELSLAGQRVITDTGTGSYEVCPERAFDRSTPAHNTVEVDGRDSTEVWGGFRVGRRGSVRVLYWEARPDGFVLEAEHDGYRHLPSRALHRRRFEFADETLEIKDRIELHHPADVAARLHLAPGTGAEIDGQSIQCQLHEVGFLLRFSGPVEATLETGIYHPEFGVSFERAVVVLRARGVPPSIEWSVNIKPLRP